MSDEKSKATLLKEEIMMKGSKGAATLNAEAVSYTHLTLPTKLEV